MGALSLALGLLVSTSASGQEPVQEDPDPTRLDVERLPPEAIEITRDLYAHGFFIESQIGARGFIGGIGDLARAGFYASVGLGYELLSWLWVRVSAEASFHETDAPAPPSPTVFEVIGFVGEVRLQWNASARVALFLGGEAGLTYVTTDVLDTYGFGQSDDVGVMYGGQLGLDFHMKNRHHSLGITGGARAYPSLEGPTGEAAVGVRGSAYLRFVF
jgi:hypothetical protein